MGNPRIIHCTYESLTNEHFDAAVTAWKDDLLVLDNNAVNALAGDANNPHLQARITEVKGVGRKIDQPMGWTRPFDDTVLETIDTSSVQEHRLKALFQSPEKLTELLGGLAFVRATADLAAKKRLGIPDAIIPIRIGSEVQIYSPTGNTVTEKITKLAMAHGVEPVMTSANHSGRPETVTPENGEAYISELNDLNAAPQLGLFLHSEETKPLRPRGSYPILSLKPDHLAITRHGCFAPEILQAALGEYSVKIYSSPSTLSYPEHVLRMQDLTPETRSLRGAEFRESMLKELGWWAND